jgi:hypothetical protein
MKIYISHSTRFNFKKELYRPLKKAELDCTFIFPHDKSGKQYPVKKLLSSKKCGLVIAEVSFPSTGQGIELGWANTFNIPIVCIYKEASDYSKALNLVAKKLIPYKNSKDLIEKIRKII